MRSGDVCELRRLMEILLLLDSTLEKASQMVEDLIRFIKERD